MGRGAFQGFLGGVSDTEADSHTDSVALPSYVILNHFILFGMGADSYTDTLVLPSYVKLKHFGVEADSHTDPQLGSPG